MREGLHCMDCVEGMAQMEAESVDMVMTSPPYDDLRTYGRPGAWTPEVFQEVARALTRVLKPGGVIAWNVNDATIDGGETLSSFRQAIFFKDECGLRMHDTMYYRKPAPAWPSPVRYGQVMEYVFVLSKGKPKTIYLIADKKNSSAGDRGGRHGTERLADGTLTDRMKGYETAKKGWRRATERLADGTLKSRSDEVAPPIKEFGVRDNVWLINNTGASRSKGAHRHPASMPDELAWGHILSWSEPGDLVLDPFTGSGTTWRMAARTHRRFIGFEINKEFVALARELQGGDLI